MVSRSVAVLLLANLHVSHGGWPISDPTLPEGQDKAKYNLIDADPSCFHEGVCPMFPPGGQLSVFPNSEEKYQQFLHNLHRMHPTQSLKTPIGKWLYGANTLFPSFFHSGGPYCGESPKPNSIVPRKPLYWYSDANQMARFKQWDEKFCDQDWYKEPRMNAHSTCGWGTEDITVWGPDNYCSGGACTTVQNRCTYFDSDGDGGGCGLGDRGDYFCHDKKDNCWFETEGICGGNSCLQDSHCDPIFATKYDYVGKGFVSGMNGVAAVYSRFTKEIFYKLPSATHFDERIRIGPDDLDSDGKHFNLMLEYYDYSNTETPSHCYALYNGQAVDMDIYLSDVPSPNSLDDFHVMFQSKFTPPTQCHPYAFLCKTSSNNFFRLPEDPDYFFGTDWLDWAWSDYDGDYGLACEEQHYYHVGNGEWRVNSGPKLDGSGPLEESEIWYYAQGNGAQCMGCDRIAELECLEESIRAGTSLTSCS